MKKKDTIYAVLAVLILMVAGYIGYTQLVPHKAADAGVKVEKVGSIPAQLDSQGMARISDVNAVMDFNLPVDLTGLGNQAPFGP